MRIDFLFIRQFCCLCILLVITGCRTTERVIVEHRTDTCFVLKTQRDSIFIETLKHDSVTIREKGDTVLIERWHTQYQDRWREREVHDTIYISKRDSTATTVTVTKETPLTWWQQLKSRLTEMILALVSVVVLLWALRHKR